MVTVSRDAVLPHTPPPLPMAEHTLKTIGPEFAIARQRVIDARTELKSAEEYLAALAARSRELMEEE